MSSKKLHDILNPSSTPLKDNDKLISSNHKSPFQRPNNLLPTNPSPSAEFPHTPPLYMNLPKNQNIFYDPMLITRHEAICSSPMFHESQNTIIKGYLPRSLMGSYLSSETSEENTQNNKNKYNQVSPYFHSNFHELHIGSTIQPKNLKELIQRSFSTVPSNSPFQASFHSVMPSPFLSHGTPNSHFCPSTALKASNQCSSGILGTPLQNPCVLQEKNLNSYQQNQSTLICKLAKISGKENEKTIETAENQIIPKLQAFEIMTEGIIYKEADKSPCPKHSPQDYYKNQILKMLSSPNVQDLQYHKSPNYHGEFSGQLTESQFQRLNNGMLQDSCSELKNSSFGQQRREDRGVNNTKIKSWTKKPVTNRISKNRGKTFGKRPRIKGRFITLEEYMVYRKGRSDDENNDMRSSWSNPLFGENL